MDETSDPGRTNANDGGNPLEGLKILAVDDNEADLEKLQTALLSLGYQVMTCCNHDEAMTLFQEGGHVFDAVLANIDLQIGFKFVEYVGQKMDLPVIVTCSVEDKKLITEAINHGACFGFVKPLGIDELHRIWQFVLAHRRRAVVRNQESSSGEAGDQSSGNEEITRGRKRRECECDDMSQPHSHGNLVRQCHLVWTEKLDRRFVEICQSLGDKNATPKRVHELMNEPFLTRKNIASRLQKYRLALKKAKEAPSSLTSSQKGGKKSKSSGAASSNAKRRVVINEPVPMNMQDISGQLVRYSLPNVASLPNVNSPGSLFLLGNMTMQPYLRGMESRATGMQLITGPGGCCNCHCHARSSFRGIGPSDELTGRTLSFSPSTINRGSVISNQMIDHGLRLERPTPGFVLSRGSYGTEKMETWNRDLSHDPISSVLRIGATQEIGESSQGNRNVQEDGTEDPAGNGGPNVDETPEDNTAMTPSPRNTDSRAYTNNSERTDGEEADHSNVTCHCKYE